MFKSLIFVRWIYDFQVYEFSKWNKQKLFCTLTNNPINNKCYLAIFKKKFTFFFAERYFFFDTNAEDIFMNSWVYFSGTVAQWIEQRPSKPKVEGSTPSCPAIFLLPSSESFDILRASCFFYFSWTWKISVL